MIKMFMQNSIAIMTTDGSEFKMIVLGFVARFDLPREVFGSQDAEGFAHGKKWHHAWTGHRGCSGFAALIFCYWIWKNIPSVPSILKPSFSLIHPTAGS